MSASVNGDNISLTRGDTLILNVVIEKNEEIYTPTSEDTIRFALNTHKRGREEPIIYKDIDPNTMKLVIEPEDTKDLEYGVYWYDIEITTGDGYVDTFIGPAKFKITEEVY